MEIGKERIVRDKSPFSSSDTVFCGYRAVCLFYLVCLSHGLTLSDLGAHYAAQADVPFFEILLPQPPKG